MTRNEPPRLVLVRGIMVRSGTNYLRDLLLTHPHTVKAREPVWEDYVLDDVDLLTTYVDRLVARWAPRWGVDAEAARRELAAHLGDGLVAFLAPHDDGRIAVAKTPSVKNLREAMTVMPSVPVIVLVRDGRAASESARRSFGWSLDRGARTWDRGAREILSLRECYPEEEGSGYLIVRYEELVADPLAALKGMVDFLGMDPELVDNEAVHRLPVRGSSSVGTVAGSPSWRPVERPAGFDPLTRSAGWGESERARFSWIAGRSMAALGYGASHPVVPNRTAIRQHLLDVVSFWGRSSRRVWRHLRRRSPSPGADV